MHVGLPIIAYDVNFNRIVTHNNALIYKNSEQLSKQVLKYYENSELGERNGIEVKKIAVNDYGWVKVAREYKELFKS